MTGPDDIGKGKAAAPVPFFRLETLKKRAEFKGANGGGRYSTPGFTMLRAPLAGGAGIRFGFTVTKKLGKAVLRNRIRRRLRAAALAALRRSPAEHAGAVADFVILARGTAATLAYATLCEDMARALDALMRRSLPSEKGGDSGQADKRALGKTPPLA